MRQKIEWLDSVGVKMVGADLVVKCWRDPAFQERLVKDGKYSTILWSEYANHITSAQLPLLVVRLA